MLIKDLSHKKIMVWGLGTEGKSVLRYLLKHNISQDICIYNDENTEIPDEFKTFPFYFGDALNNIINNVDVVIKSPGVSIYKTEIIKAKNNGVLFTSSTDLCFNEVRKNHPLCKLIAVTGSKGKSTSVSALYHIMKEQGCSVALGGNIGKPLIELIDENYNFIIAETSSYQAADLTCSPHVALFTNLFFVHTSWHLTHENYCLDKLHLIDNQSSDDICFINKRNPELMKFIEQKNISHHNISYYDTFDNFHAEDNFLYYKNSVILNLKNLKLCGNHNLDNLAGVFSVLKYLGFDISRAVKDMETFEPLTHRLQNVKTLQGVTFINDSISTAPEAAIGAMKSFDGNIAIISGGQENGQDYSDYADFINNNSKIKLAVTLFQCGPQIAESIKNRVHRNDFKLLEASSLEQAVQSSFETLKSCGGGTVLFSPTSPSFGFYKNFMERGQHFIDIVNNLDYK